MRKRVILICLFVVSIMAIAFTIFSFIRPVTGDRTANGVPHVVPGLREWHGGSGLFTLTSTSRIAVDPAYATSLQETAQVFQDDLFKVTGYTLSLLVSKSPQPGDFLLTLNNPDRSIGDEGYLFNIGDTLVITANSSKGAFYGTRTALQILAQDTTRSHIVKGSARDYPKYKERGFMLDAGRKFFSITALEDYVKLMSWYKMNDFQIHLNDNELDVEIGSDWMHKYAAFRLNSEHFKGLAARDGSYTRQDIRALLDVARKYAVTITPEIDTPAHALAFTQYHPNIASQEHSKEFLDLNNPNTYTFMNAIWDEFLPWFTTSQVHIGADEYIRSDADKYRQYVNRYNDYLKRDGKTIRVWGSETAIKSKIRLNSDIVVEVWNNAWANPVDMVRQGLHIINSNDNLLYIVPKAGYYHDYLDTRLLYEKWEPYIFDFSDPRLNLAPGNSSLLGGMFAEWNDKLGSVVSDLDVYERVRPAMQTVGEKLWSGTTKGTTYDQFQTIIVSIGEAPGIHLP